MRLSKRQIKEIGALQQKKFRQKNGLFIVEGEKIAEEVLTSPEIYNVEAVLALDNWIHQHQSKVDPTLLYELSNKELERVSALKNPNQVLIVLQQKTHQLPPQLDHQLSLVLDHIQDPGNLGTIIRIADWFGIQHIFCSPDTVEFYNPKVLQATMGSFLRVKVHTVELTQLFKQYPNLPRYGALLDGKNVFSEDLPEAAFLLIGNESKGLSPATQEMVSHPIMIPRYGEAESLNAAIATGILCASFRK